MITINRCIIICAYNEYSIKSAVDIKENDYIICADAGYKQAIEEGLSPDIAIGDFDSYGKVPQNIETIKLPVEKDDTDTLYCVKYAIEKGFKEIIIIGGIGGRLDQTIANIQTVKYAYDNGCKIWLCDGKNKLTYIKDSSISINKENSNISVFSYGEKAEGVFINGTKYTVNDGILYSNYPIGVSNEFAEDTVNISVRKGKLLIVLSRD